METNKYSKKSIQKNKKPQSPIKVLLYVFFVSIILVIFCLGYSRLQKNRASISQKTIPAAIQNASTSATDKNSSTDNNTLTASNNQTGPSSSSSILTTAPSGSFVSNHRPSLSDAVAPKEEESTCVTLPGANCAIKFVKSDGSVKELATQIAPQNGVVIWNWDVRSAGFTEGEWTVTATAYSGGRSLSTTDSIKLTVLP